MIEKIINADAIEGIKQIESETVDMCVTSPPYFGLRVYSEECENEIGREQSPEEYIEKLVSVFREVKRVLKKDGTLWLNIADSYAGSNGKFCTDEQVANSLQKKNKGSFGNFEEYRTWKHESIKNKDLIGIPWMLAFALRDDGWYLRQDIIWSKNNPMPESVKDRCTRSHEYIFLLSKRKNYYYDNESIQEKSVSAFGNRNKRSVWAVNIKPNNFEHYATYPIELIRPCILAGSRKNGIVLDPFFGSGTTGVVAVQENRGYIGIEINNEYVELAKKRISNELRQYKFEI